MTVWRTPAEANRIFNRRTQSGISLLLAILLGFLGLGVTTATAATGTGGIQVTKELDLTQGAGFTAPNTFETGSLVRYRISVSCSSNVEDCGVMTVTDNFDPNLTFQALIPPTTSLPISKPPVGMDPLVFTIGSAAAPVEGGTTLEFIVVAKVSGDPTSGTIPNEAAAVSTSGGTATSDVVTIKVPDPVANYDVAKSATPTSTSPGGTINWGVYLYGAALNNVPLSSVTVVDTYPAGAVVVNAAGGVVDTTNHTITWTNVSLTLADILQLKANYDAWKTVTLQFPNPPFVGGETVTNNVSVEFHYADGTKSTDSASATAKIVAANPTGTMTKGTNQTKVVAGGKIDWGLEFTNTGNTTLTNVTTTDIFPTSGFTSFTISRTSYTQPVFPTTLGPILIEVTSDGGATWSTWITYTTAGQPSTFPALPAGTNGVRMTDASIAPGEGMRLAISGTTDGSLASGTTLTNCATTTSDNLPSPIQGCATSTVVDPYINIKPMKKAYIPDPASGTVKPGDLVTFVVGGHLGNGSTVTRADITDLLPPQFEYLRTECFGSMGVGSGFISSMDMVHDVAACKDSTYGPDPSVTATIDQPVAGTTQLSWNDLPVGNNNGIAYFVVFTARVKAGTAIGSYTNTSTIGTTQVTNTACVDGYGGTLPSYTELVDYNGNGKLDTVCQATAPVIVTEAAIATVEKWDLGNQPNVLLATAQESNTCPDWNGFTRYPCVAQTDPDTDFQYKFRFTNYGNIDLTNYVAYDILPFITDTGVVESLSDSARGTVWQPVLTGPLSLDTSLTTATNSNLEVLYNLTSNPCRPELANGLTDTTWQASCDDTWYTAAQITDWTTVKSFKILAFQDGEAWAPGEQLILDATMHAPAGAPSSSLSGSNVNLSVAWNSIGHREYRLNANGSTVRLLAAEPRKVGIIVPLAPAVSVGDYVWYDTNNDGLQSAGENPVPNVTVNLYDASGDFVTSTTTNANGYYSFVGLEPGASYTLEFIKPSGYSWTAQDVNGTSNVQATDGTDSDVNADGKVTFIAPASGSNLPGGPSISNNVTDNPSLDAGLILPPQNMNLVLTKTLDTKGPFLPGQEVSYTLTPSNEGPAIAAAGWSVTDLLPTGLTPVSMTGTGYSCDITTDPTAPVCTADAPLAAGATGEPITLVVKIGATFTGTAKNVAYVAPAKGDLVETNPLVVPTRTTDTSSTDTDNDDQASLTVDPVSVGDYVWYDVDRDGVQDSGEAPYAGMTVQLYLGTDTSVAPVTTTTTNADGYYSFTGLLPSTQYTVKFVKAADETFTTQDAGAITSNSPTADLTDSDANPASGEVTFTTTATGANKASVSSALADNPGIDAGIVKYNLKLAKALETAGPFVPGQTVTFTLTPHNDGPVDALAGWSVTDSLPAGLTLVSMEGAGYDCTVTPGTCVAAAGLAADTDGEPITVTATIGATFTGLAHNVAYVTPASTDGVETNPLVVPGTGTNTDATDTDNDAQADLTVAKVSIGDYVWWDNNRDGQQTSGEPFIAGATVELWKDGALVRSTTTDPAGYYAFTDLLPSTDYVVKFVAPDAQSAFTTQKLGAVATDSNPNPATGEATVKTPSSGDNLATPGDADDPTIDAGFVKFNLSLTKVLDTKAPYYPGQTVTFTLVPHNDGPSAALAGWTVNELMPAGLTFVSMTGDAASYDCTGSTCEGLLPLAAGANGDPITVRATIKAGFLGAIHNVAYVAPSPDDVIETLPLGPTPRTDTITSATATDNDAQADLAVAPVSVGDYTWFDVNRDGLQSAGEPVVDGVKVNLLLNGAVVQSTTTLNGYYAFAGLAPNTEYSIEFVKPAGMTFTTTDADGVTSNSATADLTDSDASTTGSVTFTTPTSGSNLTEAGKADNPGLDAGFIKYNLKLAKAVTSSGPYYLGATPATSSLVTFSLTPHNDGPVDSLAGWSVTDILPAGLTMVSMTGAGYDCTTTATGGTCVAKAPLAAGTDGQSILVTARVSAGFSGSAHNVAYVAPSDKDAVETTPLVTPTTGTDTSTTATDNDAQADINGASLVSVGDYVWWDTNRDGVQNENTPLSGITVRLLDAAGVFITSTTTSATGFYSFTDLVPDGHYIIEFVKPPGTSFTTLNSGVATTDSDADLTTGRVSIVAPSSGSNSATSPDDPTWDAGLVLINLSLAKVETSSGPYYVGSTPETSSLVTWTLTPHNDGPVDALAGWSVTEVLPAGLTLVSMTGPGYTAKVGDPATLISDGILAAGADGSVITVTARLNGSAIGEQRNVAYVAPAPGETPETNVLVIPATGTDTDTTDTDNDASDPITVASLVSIGDYVWFDNNRNGLQDDLAPLGGVTVTLYAADGATVLKTTTTSSSGYYAFNDLVPSTNYVVGFTKPANTAFTTQQVTVNPDPAADSNPDVTTGMAPVLSPASGSNRTEPGLADDPTIDAGLIKLVSIGDYVWYDRNRDGSQGSVADEPPVAGVTVNLLDAAGAPVKSTVTNADGFYSFTDLLAGATYTVEFVKPADTAFTGMDLGYQDVDSDVDPATGKVTITAPTDGLNSATTPDDPTIDAGLVELVSVGDYVWYDADRDGVQDEGELPVAGVVVNLYDASGALVGTTTTDASGFYSFNNLLGGAEYSVEFVKPANTVFTEANAGDDALDSDADVVTGKVTFTAPITGTNSLTEPDLPTIDAGLIKLVSVGDYVWFDSNRDGVQDAGEPAVVGMTVKLYQGTVLVGETVTDANGFYSFNNLLAGADYTMWFVKPDNTVFTSALQGATTGDSNADVNTGAAPFTAPADGLNSLVTPDDPTIDAGLIKLVSIGDYVWYDNNRDGLQDAGEAPVPGVTVNLYDAAGVVVATTTTDGNGFYSFNNLLAGAEYTVEFVKPAGTAFTDDLTGDALLDSNADMTTGKAVVTAPMDGNNSLTNPDDPTIDAGLVKYNLSLTKERVGSERVKVGDLVTFTLTPHNDGPADAMAGWSVTDILPSGLTLVSMTGEGYTCSGSTCVAEAVLVGGADGPVITVVAKVGGSVKGRLWNVAYVAPNETDPVTEGNPLEVPTGSTDTDLSSTDNDSRAPIVVTEDVLPQTGTEASLLWLLGGGALTLAGGLLLVMAIRRRREGLG